MGTQKSRLDGGTRPPNDPPSDDEQDLGIPTDGPYMAEDPAGFTPKSEPTTIAGRRMRPLQEGELSEAHRQYAGDKTPMFGVDSFRKDGPPPDKPTSMPPPRQNADPLLQQQANAAQSARAAQRLMPGFLQDSPAQMQQQAPPPMGMPAQAYQQQPQMGAPMTEDQQLTDFRMAQTTAALEYLTREEKSARDRGDYLAAEQAHSMAERLNSEYDIKRVPRGQGRHPAMAKLLANLGLERIERATVQWAGSDWTFAPSNATLDAWVSNTVEDDGRNFPALVVSAGLVALDKVPLYEALRIPLDATLVVTDKATGAQRKVDVAMYRKYCDCGHELVVTAEKCDNCGTLHDPLDIPRDLRMKCAEAMYNLFENEFGAYEELVFLLEEKNKVMPDRQRDKEKVYPLAMPSPEQNETTDSQSGDES